MSALLTVVPTGTAAAVPAGHDATRGASAVMSAASGPAAGAPDESWLPSTPANWPLVVDRTNTPNITVTSGVTEHGETYDTVGGRQHAQVLDVNLANPNVRLGIVEAGDRIENPSDETLTSMGGRTGAVAGINGDYFDINATGQPDGGVISGGQLLKSPEPNHQAQLGIEPDGGMVIGQQTYQGTVADGSASTAIASVNTTSSLNSGGVVEINPYLGAASKLPASTYVLGTLSGSTLSGGTLTVTSVTSGVTSVGQLAAGTAGLLGAGAGGAWLAATVHVGDHLTINQSISPNNDLTQLVSGVTVLVKDGQQYNDPTGQPPGGSNPETAVGLSRDGKHAILVAIDGRQGESVATDVTPAQVAGYLLAHGAYTGLLFDGGGSTELVARQPGANTLSVMNSPSDNGERPVANGIFVYSTAAAPGPARRVAINNGQPVTTVPGASIPVPVYATDRLGNPARGTIHVRVEPSSLASWSNGQLTVARTGHGLIIARDGTALDVRPLTVTDRLSSLTVTPAEPDLDNGGTQQFGLTATAPGFGGRDGAQVPAAAASWRVSDPSLGSVNAQGLFTAAGTGTGLVTVTATAGGLSASTTVAVGHQSSTVDDMSDVTSWSLRNTTGGPAALAASPGDVPPGSGAPGSLALSYTVPAGHGVKQLVLHSSKNLTVTQDSQGQTPTQLGIWIKGDDSGLWFAESYVDISGTTTTLYPTYVTFNGWRLVTADIPPGLNYPLSINFLDFLSLNPTSTVSGALKLGGIEALYSPRPVVAPPYVAIPKNPSWLRFVENAGSFSRNGDTLLLGDDAHLLAADPGSTASNVLASIRARIPTLPAQARPNRVQALGDMADDGALPDLRYANSELASLGLPYQDAVGNHEISQGALPENGDFAQVFGATHYTYTDGAAQVIVTDSGHGGLLASDPYQNPAEAQYPWLVAQLSQSTARDVIVATHMPAYDPHPAADSQFGDRWEARMYVRLIQRYQQTHPGRHVVMAYGHARGFAEQILDPEGQNTTAARGGVPQLTLADLGMPAYAPSNQGGFYHFGLVHVTSDGRLWFSVEPVLSSIAVTAPGGATLTIGQRLTLSATGTEVSGDNLPVQTMPIADPASHVWSSSDPAVVRVDARTGAIRARRAGTATITVTSGGITGSVTLTVG